MVKKIEVVVKTPEEARAEEQLEGAAFVWAATWIFKITLLIGLPLAASFATYLSLPFIISVFRNPINATSVISSFPVSLFYLIPLAISLVIWGLNYLVIYWVLSKENKDSVWIVLVVELTLGILLFSFLIPIQTSDYHMFEAKQNVPVIGENMQEKTRSQRIQTYVDLAEELQPGTGAPEAFNVLYDKGSSTYDVVKKQSTFYPSLMPDNKIPDSYLVITYDKNLFQEGDSGNIDPEATIVKTELLIEGKIYKTLK